MEVSPSRCVSTYHQAEAYHLLHKSMHALGVGMGGDCKATGEHANSQSPPPIQLLVGLHQALPSVTGQQHCAQQLAPSTVYWHVPWVIPVTDPHYSMHAWEEDMQPQESSLIIRASVW